MKLLDYSGLQRFLSKIKTLLDSKANTGHTHVTSEVTDLLNSQHTWSAQQSYSADLNLNYANTDVDDILDTVASSYTAEDFLAQNNVWTGSNSFHNVTPETNNTYDLGSSSYQWNKIYGKEYYYNGTEFQSKFVTLDTSQTISAIKTITGGNQGKMIFKNPNFTVGTTPESSTTVTRMYFGGSASYDSSTGIINNDITSDGYSVLEIGAINNNSSSSNRTSLILRYEQDQTRPRIIKSWGDFCPYYDNTYYLGRSDLQWKSVYAVNYYYNGTEFQNKFVTLDTTQTISANKTFTGEVRFQASNLYHIAEDPYNVLKSSTMQEGVVPSGDRTAYTGHWLDKDSSILGYDRFVFYSAGVQAYEVNLRNKAANGSFSPSGSQIQSGYQLALHSNGNSELKIYAHTLPNGNNTWDLGDSTHQWANIYGTNLYSTHGTFTDTITVTNFTYAKNGTLVKGTQPTKTLYTGMYMCDKNGIAYKNNALGIVENSVTAANLVSTYMRAIKNEVNSQVACEIAVRVDASGNAYTYAPTPATTDNNTKIATTAFVRNAIPYIISGGANTSAGNITPVNGTIISGFADSRSVTLNTFGGVLTSTSALYYATCIYNTSDSTMAFSKGSAVGGTGTWKLMGGGATNPGTSTKLLFGLWIKIA